VAELARFLDGTTRVQSRFEDRFDDASPAVEYAVRPYPSAGGSYELELYLAVDACEGLARGFYHYDAGAHALVPITVPVQMLEAQLRGAQFAMGAPAVPQILITIAARFGRVSWKYSSIAFSLILKDAGALMQTFYLMATDMGLRDRHRQSGRLRENDRHRLSRRGAGRAIRPRPRRAVAGVRLMPRAENGDPATVPAPRA
jgi:SagB-type dehydrogenase family enzyme